MIKYIILLHILVATIWVGGHLVLALGFLPAILKNKDLDLLNSFESRYEKVGMPALLILVVTGIYMALYYLPFTAWFNFDHHLSRHITLKLILLATTIALALHARLRLIPNLSTGNLRLLAVHIIAITVVAVLFVVTGLSIRLSIF